MSELTASEYQDVSQWLHKLPGQPMTFYLSFTVDRLHMEPHEVPIPSWDLWKLHSPGLHRRKGLKEWKWMING